jgi:hypothetical protein
MEDERASHIAHKRQFEDERASHNSKNSPSNYESAQNEIYAGYTQQTRDAFIRSLLTGELSARADIDAQEACALELWRWGWRG